MLLWIAVSFIIVILDQVSKLLTENNLSLGQSSPIIKNIFHLSLVHNTGAAFGIFKNQTLFFILTSVVAIMLILFNLKNSHLSKQPRIYQIALSLILGGALGNLIDRLRFGYVVDFLDFRIWPVFNIADSCVTIGAILLAYSILREAKSNIKNQISK
jgi:signal peptidase II